MQVARGAGGMPGSYMMRQEAGGHQNTLRLASGTAIVGQLEEGSRGDASSAGVCVCVCVCVLGCGG